MIRIVFCVIFFSSGAQAYTSILGASSKGPSHFDPIEKRAHLAIQRTGSGPLQVLLQPCPENNNYFTFTEQTYDGDQLISQVRRQEYIPNGSCNGLVESLPAGKKIVPGSCKGYKTLEFKITEQNPAPEGRNVTPQVSHEEIGFGEANTRDGKTINIRDAARACYCSTRNTQDKRQKCVNGNEGRAGVILVGNQPNQSARVPFHMFADLDSKHLCKPPEKKLNLPDDSWNRSVEGLKITNDSIINAGLSGFSIGEPKYGNTKSQPHTRYIYNHVEKTWCYHFVPSHPDSLPSCQHGLDNMDQFNDPHHGLSRGFTLPMKFVIKGSLHAGKAVYPSVVSLRKGADGKPYSIVAATNSTYQGGRINFNTHVDSSKPLMKIVPSSNPIEQTKYITYANFEDYKNNKPLRTMNVSGGYNFGKNLTTAANCQEPTSCANYIPGPNTSSARLCSKVHNTPLDLAQSSGDEVCYSCNGMSAGTCSQQKEVINSESAQRVKNSMQCDPHVEPPSEDALTPISS